MRRRLAVLATPVLAAPVLAAALATPLLAAASDGSSLVAGPKTVTHSSTTKADGATYFKPAGRRWN